MKKVCFIVFALLGISVLAQTDSTIYGIARKTSPPSVFLAKINPLTGVVSNISGVSTATGVLTPAATIDPYKKIFYFTDNSNNIIGLSLLTGNIVSNITMTNTTGPPYFGQFFFNCVDSSIYGLARKSSPQSVFLAKINPTTGIVTNISASLSVNAQVPAATMDPFKKRFYYIDENNKFTCVSLTSGTIISNPALTLTGALYFEQFFFNCMDSVIYGLARKNSPPAVYLSKIDPATGIVTNISSTSLSNIAIAPSACIDPINKIFYYENTATTILGVSLTTGSIVTSQTLTNSNATSFDQPVFNKSCCSSSLPLLVTESLETSPLKVYPNPSSENITVEIKNPGNYRVELINELGQKIVSRTITNEQKFTITVPGLAKGIYYLKLFDGNKIFISKVELGQ